MLTISAGQVALFEAQAQGYFISRASAALRVHAASDVIRFDDAQLEAFVDDSAGIAAQHGVTSEQGIVKWALLRIIAGERFHELAEVRQVFAEDQNGERMMALLYERLATLEQRRKT